jgi:hypothetical protein
MVALSNNFTGRSARFIAAKSHCDNGQASSPISAAGSRETSASTRQTPEASNDVSVPA